MITLYHGSYIAISAPLVGLGRKNVDFGQGFYLTKLKSQALSWAKTIAQRKGRNYTAVLSAYEMDYDSIVSDGYTIKVFKEYNLEWLDYVIDCRRGGDMQNLYDMIEGGCRKR